MIERIPKIVADASVASPDAEAVPTDKDIKSPKSTESEINLREIPLKQVNTSVPCLVDQDCTCGNRVDGGFGRVEEWKIDMQNFRRHEKFQ